MRPDRRFGVGALWLVLASLARGQDWKPEPVDPKGHSGDVVAVSTVGKTLATASLDGTAKAWDFVDGKLTHRVDLIGHDGKVLAVAVSPLGLVVATGGADRTVRLWDALQGTPLATLQGHSGPVEALAFSPDGKTLASAGLDTSIRLWEVEAKQVARTLQGHEQGVRGLAFSPDGKTLASASRDRSVRLWEVSQGTERATLGHHDAPAWCVAFAPDGATVASGGLDKTVRLWRVAEAAPQPGQKPAEVIQGAVAPVPNRVPLQRLGRAPVEDAILFQQQPQPLEPPAPPGADLRRVMLEQLDKIRGEVPDVFFVQQPLPAQLGGGVGGGFAQIEQVTPPAQPNLVQIWQAGADVVSVAFTPDGRYVAGALSDLAAGRSTRGSVEFFAMPVVQPNQPRPAQELRAPIRGHLGPILGLAFAKDGRWVATVGGDASVRTWDAILAKPMSASIGPTQPKAIEGRVMAHLDPVEALAITPDGKLVATASESAGVSLWDASSRTLIGRLRVPGAPDRGLSLLPDGRIQATGEPFAAVRALAISPDGKILATGGDGKAVSLWAVDTGLPIDTLKGHLGAITSLAFSPDGLLLASGSKDASVTLWDVAKKAEVATLARHTSAVTSLAFSPDGKTLATGGLDYTIKLWEVADGRFLESLDAHKDVVAVLAFSPDGKTLASGDRSGMVRSWDLPGKAERWAIQTSSVPIRSLAFAPDGRTVVEAGDDRTIRRLDSLDGRTVAILREAHAGPISALALGPGGKTLATAGLDRELKLWDVDTRFAPAPFSPVECKVYQIIVSPDGQTLATASVDQFARVLDLATGKERIAPIPLEGATGRLAFSPDGKALATLTVGATIDTAKVRDVATGQVKSQAPATAQGGAAVAFAPVGKTWATAAASFVYFWDFAAVQPGGLPHVVQASGPIRSIAFSPDGKALTAGLADGSLATWDTAHLEENAKVFKPTNQANDVLAISPDGRSIAIGGPERVVRVLNADTGAVRLTLPGHRRPITGLVFSLDGKLLASAADGEATLIVRDATSGEVVSNPTQPNASAGEGLACLAFSPDGKTLFAGGERGVTTFDMTEGHRPPSLVAPGTSKAARERATLKGHASPVRSLVFAEEGAKLVTRGEDGVVKVWDLLDGNRDLRTFGGADFKVQSMALRPDGKTLAVGLKMPANRIKPGDEPPPQEPGAPPPVAPGAGPAPAQKMADEVKIWDLDSGEGRGMIAGKATKGGNDRVVALAYSRDGRTLATTSVQGVVKLWDADSLAPGVDLEPREKRADIVQFSPDGKTLLGADASGQVTLWNLETGKIRASFSHDGGMNQVLISPDGKFIATAGGNVRPPGPTGGMGTAPLDLGPGAGGDVRLWDPATGRRVAVLPMPSGKVTRIAFSRDGKTLAASTLGAIATAWDVASASPVVTLAWPSGEAKYLAFSPDGKALAIGGEDETLRVWDLPAGTLRADLPGHSDAIQWVAFSPDGKTIATAGRDATVKLWDVPPESPRP